MPNRKEKQSQILPRLRCLGGESKDRGGRGNCFFLALCNGDKLLAHKLRQDVAEHMRKNPQLYCELGDFSKYGGFLAYCDLVATDGFFVEGNAEVYLTDFLLCPFPIVHKYHIPTANP